MKINACINNDTLVIGIEELGFFKTLPVEKAELYVELLETPWGMFSLNISRGTVKVVPFGSFDAIGTTSIDGYVVVNHFSKFGNRAPMREPSLEACFDMLDVLKARLMQ